MDFLDANDSPLRFEGINPQNQCYKKAISSHPPSTDESLFYPFRGSRRRSRHRDLIARDIVVIRFGQMRLVDGSQERTPAVIRFFALFGLRERQRSDVHRRQRETIADDGVVGRV
jgi:hypothetical protein